MSLTQEQLKAPVVVTIDEAVVVSPEVFPAAAPASVTQTIAVKTVSMSTIKPVNITAPSDLSFTPITATDPNTTTTYNKPTSTLAQSIKTVLGEWAGTVTTTVNQLAQDTQASIAKVKDDVNTVLETTIAENKEVIKEVNAALVEVSSKEAAQNIAIAGQFTAAYGFMVSNMNRMKANIEDIGSRVNNLNDLFEDDADFATFVTNMNKMKSAIDILDQSGGDVIAAFTTMVQEFNSTEANHTVDVLMNSSSGVRSFDLNGEGLPSFINAADYRVTAYVNGVPSAKVDVINKTKTGFDLSVTTLNTIEPQPFNGSALNVPITVQVSHERLTPMVLNVTDLNNTWMTDASVSSTTKVIA
jgi:hypothetical protein